MWFLKAKRDAKTVETHAAELKNYIDTGIRRYLEAEFRQYEEEWKEQLRTSCCQDSGIKYSLREEEPELKHSSGEISQHADYLEWEKSQRTYTSFSASLRKLIERQNLTNRAFYHRAGIDRKLFSKMYNDFAYQPGKHTAFRCCLALRLNEEEAADLLKKAGFAFSDSSPLDLAIRYCIIHRIYDISAVNGLLDSLEISALK